MMACVRLITWRAKIVSMFMIASHKKGNILFPSVLFPSVSVSKC